MELGNKWWESCTRWWRRKGKGEWWRRSGQDGGGAGRSATKVIDVVRAAAINLAFAFVLGFVLGFAAAVVVAVVEGAEAR